jgi:hypothetical protein
VAAFEVDDTQPAMAQANAFIDEKARIVWSAVGQQIGRLLQVSFIYFWAYNAENSAHIILHSWILKEGSLGYRAWMR